MDKIFDPELTEILAGYLLNANKSDRIMSIAIGEELYEVRAAIDLYNMEKTRK